MNTAQRLLISAAFLSSLAGAAMAQPGPMVDGQGPARLEKMRERMAERHSKHLAELKTKLQLQAGQEAAWNTFAQAMQPPAKPVQRPDRAAFEKLTTPERIDQMMAIKAQRDERMQKHADATKAFYATLNPEQKKTFDAETARFMAQRMGMGHGMPGGHGHPMPH
jgi:Spy/CpxP family protein refolding chaperone